MMKNSLGLLLLFIFFSSLFIYPQQNTFTSIELKEQDYFYCSLNKETIYPEVNLTLSYNNNALIIKGVVKKKNFKDGERSWRYGDGFYINFVTPDSNEKAESDKFYGFGFSLINNKPVSVLVNKDGEYFPNVLPPPTPRIFIDSLKNTALYEITIPWKNVYPFHPIKNNPAGINIVYISQNDDGSRIIQQLIDDNYDTELTNKRKFIPLKFSPTFNNELFITGEIENRVTDKNTSDITLFIYSPKQIKNNIYLEISSGGKTVTKKSFARSLSRGINKYTFPLKLPKDDGTYNFTATFNKTSTWQDSLYKYSSLKLHHTFGIIKLLCDSTFNGQINFSGNTLSYHYSDLVFLLDNFNNRKEISTIKERFDDLNSLTDLFLQEKSLLKKDGYLLGAFLSGVDSTLQPFSLIVPKNFDVNKSYNLLTALHGSGVDEIGFIKNLSKFINKENFIIIAPRGRDLSSWYCGNTEKDVIYLINFLKNIINIDKNILYGFSMGGYGVWRFGLLYPDLFNLGIVVSGIPFNPRDTNPENDMNNYYMNVKNKIPFLVIHGDKDKSLNYSYTKEFVTKLSVAGFDIDFKSISGGGHGNFNFIEIFLDWLNMHGIITN